MGTLEVEDRGEEIRVLTLNNPARRNALDAALLEDLSRALDATPRVFLLRGKGGHFCSGFDLTQFPDAEKVTGPLPDTALLAVLKKLESHPSPSVALVQGAAVGGGCDLAAACDFRVGDSTATFWMPPAKLGVVYAADGLSRMVRRVGNARAKWMLLTGRKVAAEQAEAWGLLDERVPDGQAPLAAERLCEELAAGAPLAVRAMKRALDALSAPPLSVDELARLDEARRQSYGSEDFLEGRNAVRERRAPRFKGR